MKIDFDISTLNPEKPTGVGVYMLQLLQQAQNDSEFQLIPVLKASRFKKRSKLVNRIPSGRCSFYFPWSYLVGKESIFHGPDFKLPVSRGRRVVTIHDMVVFEKKFNEKTFYENGIWKLTQVIESEPDAIIVNSEFTKAEILKYFPKVKSPIYRTYLGCDRLQISDKKSLELPEKYILFVGSIERRKNIAGVISGYENYRLRGGQAHLVMAGSLGFEGTQLLAEAQKSVYRDQICHYPYFPFANLGELYQRAEIFFFPSYYEGFGLPILEAMSLGKPVVTSNIGAMAEIAGDAACLVDPNSAEQMGIRLVDLEKDQDLMQTMSKRGVQRAQEFTWKKCWSQTKEVYKEVGSLR